MSERGETGSETRARALPGDGTADGEKLRRAHAAFEVGDFRALSALTDELAGAPDAEVAAAARELRARVAPDRAAAVLLLGALGFFVAIAWIYLR